MNPLAGESMIACDATLEVRAVPGLPLVGPGDDVAALARAALDRARIELRDEDILVFTSKIVSRAENRFVDLTTVVPSERARALADETQKDPRLVELILQESSAVSRRGKDVLVVRHRLGCVVANAGIDCSNAVPPDAAPESGPWALLLPVNPDASAEKLRRAFAARVGIVISARGSRRSGIGVVSATCTDGHCSRRSPRSPIKSLP
jgi:coenzyme F420-0:L-glutamate ligase / coenzyme F420-1:gamma-L-glutamate ligase